MANLRFIVSLTTKDNDYQLEQAASAQAAAQKLGVDVQILYADSDAITQSTQLLKSIQSDAAARPQAIVFEPVGGTAFPQVAQAAVSAKIAWAALNREADYIPQLRKSAQVPVFSISSDHKEIGRIQGRQFAALLPKGGCVLYIQGPSETSAARDRTAGMQLTVPHGVQIISLRGRWTEESAQRAVESWLRLNTSNKVQIDVVGAQNDLMAIGARKAFEGVSNIAEREKWLRLPFTGVDGLAKTGQAWVRTGMLAATVMVPTNAGQAVSMLVEALRMGRDVPERTFTMPESLPAIEKLLPKGEKVAPTV
ncbi:MAG TPA: substrate-binding domain-containing protein [Candidatus Acidoferrum sp.]|nr:substrate-binding domain-containing protein [Candidatus Acidoferrum sp.]